MALRSETGSLEGLLSPTASILSDSTTEEYQRSASRWSDIDRQAPGAIVICANEADCQNTVKWAVAASVPFVVKSGGHSEWSTIGADGIVIDTTSCASIVVDIDASTATLAGGILSKEVATVLAAHKLCAALPNSNAVGTIPYFLGGGKPNVFPVTGFGSDCIVAAKLVTARGDLIQLDEQTNPDLLWAIRGAGQCFGLVTSLTIKAFPLSALGNDQGVVWAGIFVFPIARAKEVGQMMKLVMTDTQYSTGGAITLAAPPPKKSHAIVISAKLFGNPDLAQEAFKPLYDLGPVMTNGGPVPVQNLADSLDWTNTKGQYKRISLIGIPDFDTERFGRCVELWQDLQQKCPDAGRSSFMTEWHSRLPEPPAFDSAMSHHDVHFWQTNFTWYSDAANRSMVEEYDKKAGQIMRGGQDQEDWVVYQGNTRTDPIQYRYRGSARLARLKALKKEWDPKGVFTREFL